MKHALANRCLRRRLAALAVSGVVSVLAPGVLRAAECPVSPPENAQERRTLAKDWFSRAEAADTAGDEATAVKAYGCSFRMVPHHSTAYNLARAAERAGELRLALSAHREYLRLRPDAPDRAEVDARIKSLDERVASSGGGPGDGLGATDAAGAGPPAAPSSSAVEAEARRPGGLMAGLRLTTPEWVIAGVGTAALVSGIIFNVGARAAMADCRRLASSNNIVGARGACDRARPFAYTSYVLFGTAAAAAIADGVLIWTHRREPVESVSLLPLSGGAALIASGRF